MIKNRKGKRKNIGVPAGDKLEIFPLLWLNMTIMAGFNVSI
jgi:hypothetical protein